MTHPYKVCPQCQTPTNLHTVSCARCGRNFQTQFVPPNQTQVFNAPPGTRRKPPAAVMWTCCLVPLAFLLFAIISIALQKPVPPPGPETLAFAKEMKPYEFGSATDFLNRFGQPTRASHITIRDVQYDTCWYEQNDGSVFVLIDPSANRVNQISASGKTQEEP